MINFRGDIINNSAKKRNTVINAFAFFENQYNERGYRIKRTATLRALADPLVVQTKN